MKTISIGFRSFVVASRIIMVLEPNTAPAKALREKAYGRDMLIEAQKKRKTRSIIITDSNHVILSASSPELLGVKIEA